MRIYTSRESLCDRRYYIMMAFGVLFATAVGIMAMYTWYTIVRDSQ
jgi:hypothetical protein